MEGELHTEEACCDHSGEDNVTGHGACELGLYALGLRLPRPQSLKELQPSFACFLTVLALADQLPAFMRLKNG